MKPMGFSQSNWERDMSPLPEMPLVSIIVPSYNQGEFIARTLDSILRQSYRPIEIIVVDGASTDKTISILGSYASKHTELRWLSEKDAGVADAVNKGLAMATGDIVGIQSSDDMYYAGALDAVVGAFRARPECGLLYGESDAVDTNDHILSHYHVPEFSWPAIFGISLCLPQQSIFFRMSVSRAIGGWNGRYFGCDLDYWLRIMLNAPAQKIPVTLSAWRSYPEQRTQPAQFAAIWEGYWRMIDESVELRSAPKALQRMARASCHLLALRYHPSRSIWVQRWHALCALVLFPTYPKYCPSWLMRPLLPGYASLRRIYRRYRPAKRVTLGPRVSPGGPRP